MPTDYTLAELTALSGVSTRTIRYYIAQGLLPSPGREGSSTRYPEATLSRLRLITRLRDAHQPLAAIRARIATLDDDEIAALAAQAPEPSSGVADSALDYIRRLLPSATMPPPAMRSPAMSPSPMPVPPMQATAPAPRTFRAAEMAPPAPAPADPPRSAPGTSLGERSQWDRIAITTDIELHVRRPLTRADNRLVERLIAFARQLQEGMK